MSVPNLDVTADKPIEDKALDKDDVITLLGEDDEGETPETLELEKTPKKSKEDDNKEVKEGTKEDEEKELSLEEELEEELKEPTDDDELEAITAPRRKEILAAFPDLFKKFPYIEKAIYREQRYTELLPTIKDAEVALEKATQLDNYEKEIMGGSTESLLATIRDGDKEAFAKVVDNYMPTLFKVDQHAYYHTIGNIIKHTIISMVNDAKEQSNEDLSNAAAQLNEYMFGTTKFTHPQKLSRDEVKQDDPKEKEISEREKSLIERQYNTALGDLTSKVDKVLDSTVNKFIDPKDTMSKYVKENAVTRVLDKLSKAIKEDKRFVSIYDRLWEKAAKDNFSSESMDTIRRAYLSKAQTLLPVLISKERKDAMEGNNGRSSSNDKDRKGPLPVGKTRGSTPSASGSAKQSSSSKPTIPRGMTTLEFLNSDD